MSKPIDLTIQCKKGYETNNSANKKIVDLIREAYEKKTRHNDFSLTYFDIFLDNTDVSAFLNEETTLHEFLTAIQEKYTTSRGPMISTIRDKIKKYNSELEISKESKKSKKSKKPEKTSYSFDIIVELRNARKQDTSTKKQKPNTDLYSENFNTSNMVQEKSTKLPFIFSSGVDFIKYILKQHVFDKLHDTVYSRCSDGPQLKSSFDSLKPIKPVDFKNQLCEVRKILRSPLITIFTDFISSPEITPVMGREIVEWVIHIFSIPAKLGLVIGTTKDELVQNIKDITKELDKDTSAECGDMEGKIQGYEMKKIEEKENIAQFVKGDRHSRITYASDIAKFGPTVLADNAMSVGSIYFGPTIVAHSAEALFDGASKDTTGKYNFNASQNDGRQLYTKVVPYTYHMYWEEDPENFYQKIEIELKKENGEVNGKIDITITLCIGGHEVHSTIENYDLFSTPETRAAYMNSDSIIEMITQYRQQTFRVSNYNSTQHFGKALGDFFKNMQFFSLLGKEYVPFNEKSDHKTYKVAIGATDRLASSIAIELGTESSYKVREATHGQVITTVKGHISTIVTLFLDNIKKITHTDKDENVSSSSSSSIKPSKSTCLIQGLSTTPQILPPGFEIVKSTDIKDDYSLFRSLLRYWSINHDSTHEFTTDEIGDFKDILWQEISYQLSPESKMLEELKSILRDRQTEYNRRTIRDAFNKPDYRGGFFEIQIFATLHNKSIIVHDYSDGSEVLHEFHPIESLIRRGSKIHEHSTIHLYYDGTHYSLLTSSNTNSGGGSRKKVSESIYTDIDLSTITDLEFVLGFDPLNREHLERFGNHKKSFNNFLLFLGHNQNIQQHIKEKIVISFIFHNKEYSFFTSTLHQALMVNQLLLKNVKSMISKRLEKSKTRISKKNPTQNKIRNISRSKNRISMQSKNRNNSRNKRNPTNAMIRNHTTRKNTQSRQFLPFFY
jgi:hypothetical protein